MQNFSSKAFRAALIAAPILLIVLLILSIILLMRPAVPAQAELSSEPQSQYTPIFDDSTYSDVSVSEASKEEETTIVESSTPSAASSTASSAVSSSSYQPVTATPSEQTKAVWISFLEMQNILKNKSEAEFTRSLRTYLDNCASLGINTVIFHARSHGDAFYKSALYPTSVHFTGTRTASAPFDPLSIAVKEAHARGMKIEAWVNPYRGPEIKDTEPLYEDGIFAKWLGTDKVFTAASGSKTYYYLNPASREVQEYVLAGVREIAAGYDVDGIHFDDYFYPTTEPYPDAAEYANYTANGGTLSLADYRRDCVSNFIAEVYSTVKSVRNITFGISPSGNIDHNINAYYADVKLWGSTAGYVDYLAPQLYWSYGEGSLPYETVLSQWAQLITCKDVKLIVGLAAYKVGTNDYWKSGDILARQVADAKNCELYAGFALFRYESLFDDICNTERNNLFKN